jgi:long-subunit fatty acid transport protein
MAGSYGLAGFAMKMDFGDRLSLGLQMDPTFGADVGYPAQPYPLAGTRAVIDSDTLTLAARYRLSDSFSLHGGLRSVGVGGTVAIVQGGTPAYVAGFATDRDTGFLAGVAYEKPEIALRVALTYFSDTTHAMPATLSVPAALTSTSTVTLPQSVNLDFQSGIAANTLIFGQVRWVDWTALNLVGPGGRPLLNYSSDSVSYSLGIGRKFNDSWSGALTLGYEEPKGGIASDFAPTDGNFSVGLGATYTRDNMKITAGIRHVSVGDTRALSGGADFSGNSAVALGLKVSFSF